MMKYRNTIILLVALAALIGYVYYDQQQTDIASQTPTPSTDIKLINVNPDEVTSLQVIGPLTRTVAHKDNGAWYMDEPTKEEADTARINTVIADLAKLNATRALTDTPTDLKPFGLVTGTLTLTLQLTGNRTETVRFGNTSLAGGNYFAQHSGDPKVYLVSQTVWGEAQTLLESLPKKPTPTPTATATPQVQGPPVPTGTPQP